MKLEYSYAYESLKDYSKSLELNTDAWNRYMIEPYWNKIAQWAFGDTDHLKPNFIASRESVEKLILLFDDFNMEDYINKFNEIITVLPKEDDDPMTVAVYPSDTTISEGIYGTGVWGNIILNINLMNKNSRKWIPFVFAHEYHHSVLGFYWYCIKGGTETSDIFIESIINEGEADSFAQSIFPDRIPSWHNGVLEEEEQEVWDKFKEVIDKQLPIEKAGYYMFGNKEMGIPQNAGYYFGNKIVKAFMKKHPAMTFSELIQVPHKIIYLESGI